MSSVDDRPSMTQIYCSYLGKFIGDWQNIRTFLVEQLEDDGLYD